MINLPQLNGQNFDVFETLETAVGVPVLYRSTPQARMLHVHIILMRYVFVKLNSSQLESEVTDNPL